MTTGVIVTSSKLRWGSPAAGRSQRHSTSGLNCPVGVKVQVGTPPSPSPPPSRVPPSPSPLPASITPSLPGSLPQATAAMRRREPTS
jgi:hypothetical protein